MPKLILKFNGAVIREIVVDKPALSVGRRPSNDIVIDNPAVSGKHCKFELESGTVSVEDLQSTNGTFVNENRVTKTDLKHNDVVLVAKHSIVFVDDAPLPAAAATQPIASPDETVQISAEKLEELRKSAAGSESGEAAKLGGVRVLKGAVGDKIEYELRGLSTYIGKSDRAQIQIMGGGFFSATPEVAASIHRRAEGYVLVAVEKNYPKVNGASVDSQTPLADGDIIDCGGTSLQFFLKNS